MRKLLIDMVSTMASKNDITGDDIKSKPNNKAYQDGWDRIFKKDKRTLKVKGQKKSAFNSYKEY